MSLRRHQGASITAKQLAPLHLSPLMLVLNACSSLLSGLSRLFYTLSSLGNFPPPFEGN